MNFLDANVVVPMFRRDHVHHEVATDWWRESTARGESFSVPDIVWVAFVRIVTRASLFPVAATFEEAWEFAEAVMAQPTFVGYAADVRSLEEFVRLGTQAAATGNLVTDAYIAACAAVYGGTVVTFDRDFRKFDNLRVLELTA